MSAWLTLDHYSYQYNTSSSRSSSIHPPFPFYAGLALYCIQSKFWPFIICQFWDQLSLAPYHPWLIIVPSFCLGAVCSKTLVALCGIGRPSNCQRELLDWDGKTVVRSSIYKNGGDVLHMHYQDLKFISLGILNSFTFFSTYICDSSLAAPLRWMSMHFMSPLGWWI